jgi:hypothetical protein
VAPSFSISGDSVVAEGAEYWLTLPDQSNYYYDPGDDTITSWIVDWGDGNTDVFAGHWPGAVSHVYADGDNQYAISVRGVDEDGTWNAQNTIDVFVANVDPELSFSGYPDTIDEGEAFTLYASSTDPGQDEICEWRISWGDGTSSTYGTLESMVHTYADDGEYTINAIALDEDGSYTAAPAFVVTVRNVEPDISLSTNDDGSLYVFDTVTLFMETSDPGDDTIYQWTIDWGDGQSEQTISGNPGYATYTYAAAGSYSISATAYDEDGSYSAGTSVSLAQVTLEALTAADGEDAYNTATDDDGNGATLTFAVDGSGYGSVHLSGLVVPGVSQAFDRALYAIIDGSGTPVASGALGAAGASIPLAEGEYTAIAGIDANSNGVLDAGEASRGILLQGVANPLRVQALGNPVVRISAGAGAPGVINLRVVNLEAPELEVPCNLNVDNIRRVVPGAGPVGINANVVPANANGTIWTLTVNLGTAAVGEEFVIRITDAAALPGFVRVIIDP